MKCTCKSSSRTLQVDHDIFIGDNEDGDFGVLKTKVEKTLLCIKCGGRILEN